MPCRVLAFSGNVRRLCCVLCVCVCRSIHTIGHGHTIFVSMSAAIGGNHINEPVNIARDAQKLSGVFERGNAQPLNYILVMKLHYAQTHPTQTHTHTKHAFATSVAASYIKPVHIKRTLSPTSRLVSSCA